MWQWIVQNKEWVFSGAGIAVLGAVWWLVTKLWTKREAVISTVQAPTTSIAPVISPAITMNPTINFPTEPRVIEPSKHLAEAPTPNLFYVTTKEKRVFISPLARDGICDPHNLDERDKSVQTLVFKFENRVVSDRKIGRAMNVIAKVRFKSKDGVTERVIDYGVWLNSSCNSTDMKPGDTRELVLICAIDNRLVTFEDRREGNHQFYDQFAYIDSGSVDGLESVEITLIDTPTQATFRRTFRVWRDGARFCVG